MDNIKSVFTCNGPIEILAVCNSNILCNKSKIWVGEDLHTYKNPFSFSSKSGVILDLIRNSKIDGIHATYENLSKQSLLDGGILYEDDYVSEEDLNADFESILKYTTPFIKNTIDDESEITYIKEGVSIVESSSGSGSSGSEDDNSSNEYQTKFFVYGEYDTSASDVYCQRDRTINEETGEHIMVTKITIRVTSPTSREPKLVYEGSDENAELNSADNDGYSRSKFYISLMNDNDTLGQAENRSRINLWDIDVCNCGEYTFEYDDPYSWRDANPGESYIKVFMAHLPDFIAEIIIDEKLVNTNNHYAPIEEE